MSKQVANPIQNAAPAIQMPRSEARPDLSIVKYDPSRLFDTLHKSRGSMAEDFYNVRQERGPLGNDALYEGNAGVVRLYDKRQSTAIGQPSYPSASESAGPQKSWGHSERTGMRNLLNDIVMPGNGEIEPPSYYFNSKESRVKWLEILKNLKGNASAYKGYLEKVYPNSIIQMLSERPLCSGNPSTKGGNCGKFNDSIFPKDSTYGHIAEDGRKSSVESAYEKLRTSYSSRPWMRQPQPAASPQAAPAFGVTPSFVPSGDISTMAGSGYNPYSSVSSSSSSTAPYNPNSSTGINPPSTSLSRSNSDPIQIYSDSNFLPHSSSSSSPAFGSSPYSAPNLSGSTSTYYPQSASSTSSPPYSSYPNNSGFSYPPYGSSSIYSPTSISSSSGSTNQYTSSSSSMYNQQAQPPFSQRQAYGSDTRRSPSPQLDYLGEDAARTPPGSPEGRGDWNNRSRSRSYSPERKEQFARPPLVLTQQQRDRAAANRRNALGRLGNP